MTLNTPKPTREGRHLKMEPRPPQTASYALLLPALILAQIGSRQPANASPNPHREGISLNLPGLPLRGTYSPIKSNEPSICPQELKPKTLQNGKLGSIHVAYVGDCGYSGPYTYPCTLIADEDSGENTRWLCGEGKIWFQFENQSRYQWQNLAYGFEATFELTL